MAKHNHTGRYGEALAARFLKEKGFLIIKRNYRYKKGEIDIIARKDNLLLFVEVKTRTTINYGYPEEAVSAKKAGLIIDAADYFIHKTSWNFNIRFDIISITIGSEARIKHFEDAFY